MIYFKDKNGKVFAYSDQAEKDKFGADDLIQMTEAEIQSHLNPPKAPLTREEVEQIRLRAYSDPINGSDRFFAEAVRLQAIGAAQAEIDAAKNNGVARYNEIQAQHPWPV